MRDDTKRRFPHLTPYQEEMKKRTIQAEQELYEAMRQKAATAASSLSNPAGSVSGFGISVSNSVVRNAKVVVGWIDGITYINSEGESVSITSQNADLLISETNADGVALFPRISPEWIIEDYTGFFEKTEDGPIKLYAPIYSYGGEQDTGYDPIPLASNFSMRNVNPITTIFTSLFTNRSLQEVNSEELIQSIGYLGEWIEKDSFTDEEIEEITTGRVKPELYQDIIDPVKKAKDLFEGMDLVADEKVEVEVAGDTKKSVQVEISKASIYAAEISGIYKFNTYVEDRKKGSEKSNRITYTSSPTSKGYVSTERAGQLLGYTIASDTPVTAIIQTLYKKTATKESFVSIKTDYGDDLTKDDNGGGNVQNGILYINSATAADGNALIYGSDSIVEKEGQKVCTVTYISPDGVEKSSSGVVLTVVSEDAASKKYVYSVNLYVPSGLAGPAKGYQFKITAETTNNRTQTTNLVIINQDAKGNFGFYDLILGTLLPEIPGKGDPGDVGGGGNSLVIIKNPGSKDASSFSLTIGDGKIGNNAFATFSDSGKTYYVYWNSERWVVDNDTDSKFVIATGSSNFDTPAGDYTSGDIISYSISSLSAPKKP